MKKLLLVMLTALLLFSCSENDNVSQISGNTVSDSELVGIWKYTNNTYTQIFEFSQDGNGFERGINNGQIIIESPFIWDTKDNNLLLYYENNAFESGRYTVEGNILIFWGNQYQKVIITQ